MFFRALLATTLTVVLGLTSVAVPTRTEIVIDSTTSPAVQVSAELALPEGAEEIVYKRVGQREISMDVYRNPDLHNAPAVVYIHGGAWVSGDKRSELQFTLTDVQAYVNRGFVFFSIDYRLADTTTKYPAPVEDVFDALRFITAHAAELGVDPERIGLVGTSAGGHLGLLAAVAPQSMFPGQEDLRDVSFGVRTMVSWAGPTDLLVMARRGKVTADGIAMFMGASSGERPDLYEQASPARHVAAAGEGGGDSATPGVSAPSLLLIHGDRDNIVPYEQATLMRDAAERAGFRVELVTMANTGHVIVPLGPGAPSPTPGEVREMILEHMERELKPLPVS